MQQNIKQLLETKNTLLELSKCKTHPFAYELSYNINLINKAVDDFQKRLQEYKNDNLEKDQDGNPYQFIFIKDFGVIRQNEEGKLFVFYAKSPKICTDNYVITDKIHEGELLTNRFVESEMDNINKNLQKFENESFSLEYKKIQGNGQDFLAFSGVDFSNLFGFIID